MTINPNDGNESAGEKANPVSSSHHDDRRTFVKDASAASLLAAAAIALGPPADAQQRRAAIRTPLTEQFNLDYPIVLAPMGGAAGGDLAAAVSNAGGLGLVGGGSGNLASLTKELDTIKAKTKRKCRDVR